MAKTINFSARLAVISATGVTLLEGSSSASVTQAETGSQLLEQSIGTSTEQLVFTDVDNIGYLYLENTDPTNFIEIGITTPVSSANAMITLKPGEFAFIPTRLETIYAKSDTAACVLRHALAEL